MKYFKYEEEVLDVIEAKLSDNKMFVIVTKFHFISNKMDSDRIINQ